MNEKDTAFFKPLWRRIVLTVICLVWTGWELSNGMSYWALLTGALSLYSFWIFFIRFGQPGGQKK